MTPTIRDSDSVKANLALPPISGRAADGGSPNIERINPDVSFQYATGRPVLNNINPTLERGRVCCWRNWRRKDNLVNPGPFLRADEWCYCARWCRLPRERPELPSQILGSSQTSHLRRNSSRKHSLRAIVRERFSDPCCRRTGAAPMIEQLDLGYDTMIEEGGASLSSGKVAHCIYTGALKASQILTG